MPNPGEISVDAAGSDRPPIEKAACPRKAVGMAPDTRSLGATPGLRAARNGVSRQCVPKRSLGTRVEFLFSISLRLLCAFVVILLTRSPRPHPPAGSSP